MLILSLHDTLHGVVIEGAVMIVNNVCCFPSLLKQLYERQQRDLSMVQLNLDSAKVLLDKQNETCDLDLW